MDKNYEAYEYQSGSNANNDASQFIVVQNSGTFLSVNDRPMQYITQVEDLKENIGGIQSSIAYDVTPQQYYVNMENSSELMSVPDQFVMPDGENTMHTNNYPLPPAENIKVEQMEQGEFEKNLPVHVNAEMDINDFKTNSDCTELTLSYFQYQELEQKGWVLLETNEKTFLLDSLGLNDISTDKMLIEKLKRDTTESEDMSSNIINDEGSYEIEGHVANNIEEPIDYLNEEGEIKHEKQDVQSYLDNNPDPVHLQEIHTNDIAYLAAEHDYVKVSSFKDTSYRREGDALRIKTKFTFRDIPPEIVLGRTVNGKKLVASVKTKKHNLKSALINQAVGEKLQSVRDEEYEEHVQNNSGLDEEKFQYLIQEHLWGNTESLSLKDVNAAEIVVEQLLRVPALKPNIMGLRLLITKVVIDQYENEETCTSEVLPTMVTGHVVKNDKKVVFKHIPDLLQRSLAAAQDGCTNIDDNFLCIHIQEIKGVDGITRISIALNKQKIPLTDLAKSAKNKQNMAYACGSCAVIYNTEEGLKLHQETDCMNVDNLLTVDAEHSNSSYIAVFTDNGREYMCNQCHSIFKKLSSCQNHIKNYCSFNTPNDNEEGGNSNGLINCKMCDSTFQHQGSLSKHIINKHIKINTK